MSQGFCKHCGKQLEADSEFCPKCGKPVTELPVKTGTASEPGASGGKVGGIDKRVLIVIGVIILILIVPVFPRQRVVYVDGSTQTVVNSMTLATSVVMNTQATNSQISVYSGSFSYFSSNYYNQFYYNYPGWGQYCGWWHNHVVCNWNSGGYGYGYGYGNYASSYGTTVTVAPSMNVVNVMRTQQGNLESLTLVYYNGQQSQTYQNVYSDNLAQSGVSTVPGTTVVTNTIVSTMVNPVTETVPCQQCIATTVTDHVSLLQLLLGF